MSVRPLRRLRAPEPADAPATEDGNERPHLQPVGEATLDERLAELESSLSERLERKVDARLEALDGLAGELRAETERLRDGLEESSEAVVEHASVLVFEQMRRADAAELERTRIARASLKGLGEEVGRVREEAATEAQAHLTERIETAVSALNGRFDALEAKTTALISSELAAVRQRSESEVEALAERAGFLVFDRINAADSRVEAAVVALAREIDGMRSILRTASDVPQAKLPHEPAPPPDLPPGLEFVPLPDPQPRWPRLRRAFRLGR